MQCYFQVKLRTHTLYIQHSSCFDSEINKQFYYNETLKSLFLELVPCEENVLTFKDKIYANGHMILHFPFLKMDQ